MKSTKADLQLLNNNNIGTLLSINDEGRQDPFDSQMVAYGDQVLYKFKLGYQTAY